MASLTAVELGADICAFARTRVRRSEVQLLAAGTLDPAAFPGIEAFTSAVRHARKSLKLPRRCRAVVWGLPDGASRKSPAVKPLIAPLTGAGFRIDRVISPCNALAALARLRTPRGEGATCWLAINRSGVAMVVVRPGKQLYSHSFAWDSSIGSSGSQARLLQRYSLVAFLAPEIRRGMAVAREKGTPVDAIVTSGNLPEIRSLTMPLIEELDVEVETLDSLEGLVVKPDATDRLLDIAASLRIACAGAIARPSRPWVGQKRSSPVPGSILRFAGSSAVILAVGLIGWGWWTTQPAVSSRPKSAPTVQTTPKATHVAPPVTQKPTPASTPTPVAPKPTAVPAAPSATPSRPTATASAPARSATAPITHAPAPSLTSTPALTKDAARGTQKPVTSVAQKPAPPVLHAPAPVVTQKAAPPSGAAPRSTSQSSRPSPPTSSPSPPTKPALSAAANAAAVSDAATRATANAPPLGPPVIRPSGKAADTQASSTAPRPVPAPIPAPVSPAIGRAGLDTQPAAAGKSGADRGRSALAPGDTRKPAVPRPMPEPLKDPVPRVTAILVSSDRRMATVDDGRVITIGDVVGKRVVVGIDERAVVFREPSGVQIRVALGGRIVGVERSER
ncbi:MAG TPA: hypothetical protein VFZ98_10855 [Vicinamibacterales bacterium]